MVLLGAKYPEFNADDDDAELELELEAVVEESMLVEEPVLLLYS